MYGIGVTEPIKRILSNCNIKVVALKPYLTLGHIFAKPKDPVKTNQKIRESRINFHFSRSNFIKIDQNHESKVSQIDTNIQY